MTITVIWKNRPAQCLVAGVLMLTGMNASADPQLSSWHVEDSGQYARIVLTDADLAVGNILTSWDGTATGQNGIQSMPTYSGVHEISYDNDWIYIRTSGLGAHLMGPWYLNENRTGVFPNLPVNMAAYYRLPRVPTIPVTKELTGLGAIGYFVDGVSMFDSRDAISYVSGTGSPGTEIGGGGSGIWRRDAGFVEGPTFDAAKGHQPGQGRYHYHLNPQALRYRLGDNVLYDPITFTYSEDLTTTEFQHSPILGWVSDGLPLYGPYGFSDATNSLSPVRRITSGYGLRDINQSGVANRTTYPLWAMREQGLPSTNLTTEAGPAVSTQRALGRYSEDYDYLGDLGLTQGVDFDLNEQNARWCVTPEYPTGTWAYFVCIDTNGDAVFPYHINFFQGDPVGGNVTVDPDPVTIYFEGGPEADLAKNSIQPDLINDDITLLWNAAEGGTYTIEQSSNLLHWVELDTMVSTSGIAGATDAGRLNTDDHYYYRATQTGPVQAFDNEGFVYDNGSIFDTFFPLPLPDFTNMTAATINGETATIVSYDATTGMIGLYFDNSAFSPGSYYATIDYDNGGGPLQTVSTTPYSLLGTNRNILMMIVDDWAIDASELYNTNAGVYLANMPNLQTLADNGMLFSSAYAQPVCSPTRATMMTGRQVFQHGIGIPGEEGDFSEDETTIPKAFTAMGSPYAMASVGKWHLGGGDTGYADRGGWDEFYGITGGGIGDYFSWPKNSNGSSSTSTNYTTTDQVDEALTFIATNDASSTPWFMWAAFNAPHTPFHEPPANLAPVGGYSTNSSGDTDLDNYIHMLEALDTEIGRLLSNIDLNNTHVMIIGDNGTPGQTVQDPFGTGHAKGSLYDGGTHVPFIVQSPDMAAGLVGTTNDTLVHCIDMFSTILEMGGIDESLVPGLSTQNVLSTSIVPILQGSDSADRCVIVEKHNSSGRGIILDDYPDYKLLIFGEPDDPDDVPVFEFYNFGAPAYDINEESPLIIGSLTGTALDAYNACIAKDTELGGGYSDQPVGNFDTLYIQLPTSGVSPVVPPLNRPNTGNPINVTSLTVDGNAATYVSRVDTNEVADQYWVKAIVTEAAAYTNAYVIFPDHPMQGPREYDSTSITEAP